ncbi:sensor histidine kinase [Rhodoferax ferrireducens]|uniref:sensor histidine kinase n=1 Tax=Rhodoferax ferrireducens TaxID=192843 RepID=UPI000E0D4097|nr:histidine kinase [Rhodoferax ferrireducens]
MRIDWIAKLRHWLQTMAFCLAISFIQWAFNPERSYGVPMLYSLCIGFICWVWIDFGRHLFASSLETGWPKGLQGLVLVITGNLAGYFLGTYAADSWFGWSSWDAGPSRTQLRTSILITALAGIAVTYYFYSANKSAYLLRKMDEARAHVNEARLKLLETQLEPHMLFNTLANLRALISADPPRALQMLDHMIAYLRATLSASRAPMHPLQAEFDRLRDYLELMAVRMGPRLNYVLELPADLAQHPVPTLLLQPLVENAIQHGLEPKVNGGSITVRARHEAGWITLEVLDTGVGPPQGSATLDGFGLAQVRERLLATYGHHGTIKLLANSQEGTGASITFPLKI